MQRLCLEIGEYKELGKKLLHSSDRLIKWIYNRCTRAFESCFPFYNYITTLSFPNGTKVWGRTRQRSFDPFDNPITPFDLPWYDLQEEALLLDRATFSTRIGDDWRLASRRQTSRPSDWVSSPRQTREAVLPPRCALPRCYQRYPVCNAWYFYVPCSLRGVYNVESV